MTQPRKHYRTPGNTALCGRINATLVSLWADVECLECYKRRADFEAEQAELRAFKNTQEVVVEMVMPLTTWEEIVEHLRRAQLTHEIMGGMNPALSMLIAQLRKASIVTRKATNPTKD